MFSEDDLLPISALQHLAFCERQCALIHIEAVWADNALTAQGQALHEKVHDEDEVEIRAGVRIARGLRLRSLRLGLVGVADVVEFRLEAMPMDDGGTEKCEGQSAKDKDRYRQTQEPGLQPRVSGLQPPASLPGAQHAVPFPVEYKHGRPKPGDCDLAQLCAQAMCLEEMLGVAVPDGAIFYGKPRRRLAVAFDPALRARTEALATQLHALVAAGRTPPARYEKKCDACSLLALCLPRATGGGRSARRHLERSVAEALGD